MFKLLHPLFPFFLQVFLGTFWIAVAQLFPKKKKEKKSLLFLFLTGFWTLCLHPGKELLWRAVLGLPPFSCLVPDIFAGAPAFKSAHLLSLPGQGFFPSFSTFFFSGWLWLGKQAYKTFCILWMYHTVILLSENSVMSIIDALEKW